jgi:hypothetical protein
MVWFQSSVSSEAGVIPWLNPGCFRDASQIFSAYERAPAQFLAAKARRNPADDRFEPVRPCHRIIVCHHPRYLLRHQDQRLTRLCTSLGAAEPGLSFEFFALHQ